MLKWNPKKLKQAAIKLKSKKQKLAKIPAILKDNQTILEQVIYPWLRRHHQRQFDTGGGWGGRPWDVYTNEPLYLLRRLATTGNLNVLRGRPGDEPLMESFTMPNHPNHIFTARADGLTFGSSLPYVERLIAGGPNQFGEQAEPRDISAMTTHQQDEMFGLFVDAKRAQLRDEGVFDAGQ